MHPRTTIVLIEDDAPVMRLMSWALTDEGFDVRVVSRAESLKLEGIERPDVAVFNMKATAPEKTGYIRDLRLLNPDCIIVDVDELLRDEGSVRDSGADSYTGRPLNLDALTSIIKDMLGLTAEERSDLRDDSERRLRP
jgi:DNA-binding response OmpR family regulator